MFYTYEFLPEVPISCLPFHIHYPSLYSFNVTVDHEALTEERRMKETWLPTLPPGIFAI